MRALVLSDIHGEESQLRWMLEETWKMTGKIDGYFFLGDGVDDFAQAENFIRRRDPDALMLDVRGNNDFCCPNAPYYRVTDFGGVRLYLTHGHLERVKLTRSFLYERRGRKSATLPSTAIRMSRIWSRACRCWSIRARSAGSRWRCWR